ncbi:MAG TPA: RNA polymerase sigma factor [Rhodanobacteraceae bacterium]|nr:RNA polymerase sigma factor [Rhodanobacteraceae bacterium]
MAVTISGERARWLADHVLPVEPSLRRWLARRLSVRQDCDDVIQETYAILAGLADVSHIRQPETYVYQVAKSVVLQQLRRAQVVSIEAVADIEREAGVESGSCPLRALSSHQELSWIASLIERLPDKSRKVFILRRVEGYSQREIAAQLEISESTVEKHVGKALRKLMDWMQHDDPVRVLQRGGAAVGGKRHAQEQ